MEKIKVPRFELPAEEVAKKRLNGFRSAVKSLQETLPEIVGATVYGSMIKGTAHKESDIDSFLYIDAENPAALNHDADYYRHKLLDQMGIAGEDLKYFTDLKVKFLSEEIIDRAIQDQLDHYGRMDQFFDSIEEKYAAATSMAEKMELAKQEPEQRLIELGVSEMFHARVGSGIEKYRTMFLEKIQAVANTEKAEALWNEVAFILNTFEKRDNPDVDTQIPQTLNDALLRYAPELIRK